MSPVDRRAFLRSVAIASAAAGSGIGPAFLAARGAAAAGPVADPDAVAWKRAPCTLCGVGCGLLVGIRNGRAVSARGDPDSPAGRGLACVKGYHAVQALYGRDRLTRAMVRRNGTLVTVSLEDALDAVAARLRATVQAHGADSVALYGPADWMLTDAFIAAKLFKGGLGTNNVDGAARLRGASAAAGMMASFGMEGAAGCYEDIEHADVFVLWNSNLAETDPVLFSRILERRRTSPGVRIVVLSTRTTRTSYGADRSLVYSAHAELAIANALAHEIVARRWVNREFVERHVAFRRGTTGTGDGLESDGSPETVHAADWAAYVRFLADYAPDRVQQVTGVRPEEIRWLASLYGDRSRKVMSLWGAEVNGSMRGTWLNNAICNIHLLVGKLAAPGNAALSMATAGAGGASRCAGASAEALPRGSVHSAEDRAQAARIWGVPASRLSEQPGRTALSIFRGLDDGAVRFLWIQSANPMVDLPNLNRYRRAVRRPDRFVVVSDAYPTATTDAADVVLPAALWLEAGGIYCNTERRLQHVQQLLEPPGDARSHAVHMIEVARRIGLGELFRRSADGHVADMWAEYRRFHDDASRQLPELEALRAGAGVLWPHVDGRETRWRYSTSHDPAADRARGGYDFYGHADHRAWIWLRPQELPLEVPDREFPLRLEIGDVLEHTGTGTLTRRIPSLHSAVPHAYVELNRHDAERLGVRNGEVVRLVSRRGSLRVEARIDYRSQPGPGSVFVPAFDEDAVVNLLTLDATCPLSAQPVYSGAAVRIERLTARST
jgi:nitrate reductase (cytochrome)